MAAKRPIGTLKEKKNQADRASFSRSVIALHKHLSQVHRSNGTKRFGGRVDDDIMRVAAGLTAITRLLEIKFEEIGFGEEMTTTGLRDAFGIVEYLTTGRYHPIADHVAGLRTGYFHPQRQRAAGIDENGRALIVGAVGAFGVASGQDQAKSIRAVSDALKQQGVEVGADQIRGWGRRFKEEQHQGPAAFRSYFLERAHNDPTAILNMAQAWGFRWAGVPALPA